MSRLAERPAHAPGTPVDTPVDGVIRFVLQRDAGPAPTGTAALVGWHAVLRALGVFGRDPARYGGAAWGNLSERRAGDAFVISASQRTDRARLEPADFTTVLQADPHANRVLARGPADPSSEAMTHAALYQADPAIGAIVHGHSPAIWRQAARLGLPATAADIGYGTPAMAAAVGRCVADARHGAGAAAGDLVMLGHEDGVVCWGPDLDTAAQRYVTLLARAAQP